MRGTTQRSCKDQWGSRCVSPTQASLKSDRWRSLLLLLLPQAKENFHRLLRIVGFLVTLELLRLGYFSQGVLGWGEKCSWYHKFVLWTSLLGNTLDRWLCWAMLEACCGTFKGWWCKPFTIYNNVSRVWYVNTLDKLWAYYQVSWWFLVAEVLGQVRIISLYL